MRSRASVTRGARALLTASVLAGFPAAALSQLPNASASELALAGNATASARGFAAISVNPAGLATPGSGFSLALASPQIRLGLHPIKFSDIVDFERRLVPTETKQEWLARVVETGREAGTVGLDASALALTVGSFGLQVSTVASADVDVPPGVIEAALFGNAGRTGSARELSLAGATIESFATSTIGIAFAVPLGSVLAVGLTGKYTLGHGVAVGTSTTGELQVGPVRAVADAPLVTTCLDEAACVQDLVNGGSGFGLDIGATADLGSIALGAALQNVFNTFSWDESKLGYRSGTLLFEEGELTSDYDELPFDVAPDDLKNVVTDYTFRPAYRLGAAIDLAPALTLSGDVHGRFSGAGIDIAPRYHTGVGAELRLGLIHLRAGVAKVSDAVQYGGGASLVLGPVNLSAAGGLRKGDLSDTVLAQFTLSFGDR